MLKKFENNALQTEMYKNIILDKNYIRFIDIFDKELPINLFDAYSEYHYGIYV